MGTARASIRHTGEGWSPDTRVVVMFWWIPAQAGLTRTELNGYRPLNREVILGRVFGFSRTVLFHH
jgi:hypothetical protein